MHATENSGQVSQLRIRLLGAPVLEWEGETLTISRKQARAFIYVLGTNLQPVSRDKLNALFWPDLPDARANRNLSRLLSYIRTTLPHYELIQVNNDRICFNPELVWSDSDRFMQLANSDRPSDREEMVGLYGGLFLSGFSLPNNNEFDFWLGSQQHQYEQQYLSALKDVIQFRFDNQDLPGAITMAQQYLRIDELAENVHQTLMRLYAANGDRNAAMHQFETCTLILERELGVEPLPETRAVYAAAMSGKVSQLITKPTWTILPSLEVPLIGRDEDWLALDEAYKKVKTGGLILIVGEAGVGKTRLMREFTRRKSRTVLVGNDHATTQSLPYRPLVQALRQALSDPQRWAGISPLWLGVLTPLLPELPDYFNDLPRAIEVEPTQAQARLFEAFTQVLAGLASQDSPLFLCLDDIHWADEATLGWLSVVPHRLLGSRVCVIATCREEEDSVQGVRRAFRRAGLLAEVTLGGLGPHAISAILAHVVGRKSDPTILAPRLARITGGNTFFVLETIRALQDRGQLDSPPERLPLPKTVQETIMGRITQLTPIARQILDAAAVLFPELEPALIWATAGRTELESADGLDELVCHQLLEGKEEGLAFRHDLLRTAVYEALTPWRRQLLHRRAAEALVGIYRHKQDQVVSQIAQHYDAAGEVDKAAEYYYQAALISRSIYAHEEVSDYLQRVLRLLSTSEHKWDEMHQYYELLGESLTITGKYEGAHQVYSDFLDRIPEEATLQRVKFQTKLAESLGNLNLKDQAEEVYQEALELLSAHEEAQDVAWQQAWLDIYLKRLGLFYSQARHVDMQALLKKIQPLIEKVGTPDQRSRYYSQQGGYTLRRDRYIVTEQTILSAEANLKATLEIGNPIRIADAKFRWGFVLLWSGKRRAAFTYFEEALEGAEETGSLMLVLQNLVYLTCLRRLEGDVADARAFTTRSLGMARKLNSSVYIGATCANLAWIEWRAKNIGMAEKWATEALQVWGDSQYPFRWLANWVLMANYLARDQIDQAIRCAGSLLDPKQQKLPDDVTTLLKQCLQRWQSGEIESTRKALINAIELAQQWGYL